MNRMDGSMGVYNMPGLIDAGMDAVLDDRMVARLANNADNKTSK